MLPLERGAPMAYRELGMVEVREIVRRWLVGDGVRAIARGTGMDRKTIAEYVRAAGAVGVQRGGSPPTVNSQLICATFSHPECAIGRGTVSATVTSERGGKEGAHTHGAKHDQVPEATGAVQHPDRLARRL